MRSSEGTNLRGGDAMDQGNGGEKSMDLKTMLSFYSTNLRNRVLTFLPSSRFLGKISELYRATSRRRRACLPLPLPSSSVDSSRITIETSKIYDVLEDIMEHAILTLHDIQKSLNFWQSRAEGSNAQKMYFMIFERGPWAFMNGVVQLARRCISEGYSMQQLSQSASAYVAERISALTILRCSVATFLAQVYEEVEKFGECFPENPENSLRSLLIVVNRWFLELEASVSYLHTRCQSDFPANGNNLISPMFERLPEINGEGSQWTDCEIRDAIRVVYQNLEKMDSFFFCIVAKHRKPRRVTQYWVQYTCAAVGLSVCSLWLMRHSRLMGSSDIDNWMSQGRESMISFFKEHVEQPLLSIRGELFDTFRKRPKGVMDDADIMLTRKSLHRMLLAFSEQTKGQTFPENASDQEMLEIVMARYENELTRPIQNLLGGELARALLIQVQKLKLDIETAMLELDQILRANEINFAILAALPAFFLSLIFFMIVRAWLKKDTRAEGRGRAARIQRRLIVVEIEKAIVQQQIYNDRGQVKDAQSTFGLVLYYLDRLCHAVEKHAKDTGEWKSLRRDITELGKLRLQTEYKLAVTSRLVRVYDCLLPSFKRL